MVNLQQIDNNIYQINQQLQYLSRFNTPDANAQRYNLEQQLNYWLNFKNQAIREYNNPPMAMGNSVNNAMMYSNGPYGNNNFNPQPMGVFNANNMVTQPSVNAPTNFNSNRFSRSVNKTKPVVENNIPNSNFTTPKTEKKVYAKGNQYGLFVADGLREVEITNDNGTINRDVKGHNISGYKLKLYNNEIQNVKHERDVFNTDRRIFDYDVFFQNVSKEYYFPITNGLTKESLDNLVNSQKSLVPESLTAFLSKVGNSIPNLINWFEMVYGDYLNSMLNYSCDSTLQLENFINDWEEWNKIAATEELVALRTKYLKINESIIDDIKNLDISISKISTYDNSVNSDTVNAEEKVSNLGVVKINTNVKTMVVTNLDLVYELLSNIKNSEPKIITENSHSELFRAITSFVNTIGKGMFHIPFILTSINECNITKRYKVYSTVYGTYLIKSV